MRAEQAKPHHSQKKAAVEEPMGDVFGQAIAEAQARQAEDHGNGEQAEESKPKYDPRPASYVDREAGVKVREDRKNNLMTIALRDEPPGEVTDMLGDAGYDEARELAFQAANLIREEAGLPQKESADISREGSRGRG
jgi:hypothetical protein